MKLGYLGCLVGRHDPDRQKVNNAGFDLVGECRHCGTAIRRRAHRDWVVDEERKVQHAD